MLCSAANLQEGIQGQGSGDQKSMAHLYLRSGIMQVTPVQYQVLNHQQTL